MRAIPKIAYKLDLNDVLSQISPNMLMINDVRDCYTYKIRELGDYMLWEVYDKIYENGALKDEFKIAKSKGLIHSLFPQNFENEWIRNILSCIHDGKMWLENGLVKIKKFTIHRVIGYPTLGQPKTMWCEPKENIDEDI